MHLARKLVTDLGMRAHDNLSMGPGLDLPSCLPAAGTGAYQKHIRHCPAAPFGLTTSRAAKKRKEQRKQLVNATKMQQGIARGTGWIGG